MTGHLTLEALARRLRCRQCGRRAVFEEGGLRCELHPRAALVWLADGEPVPRGEPEQKELFG